MALYFRSRGKDKLVKKGLKNDVGAITKYVVEDLKKRKPNFQSFYQRAWYDDDDNLWIDYGSHTEFYICKPEG